MENIRTFKKTVSLLFAEMWKQKKSYFLLLFANFCFSGIYTYALFLLPKEVLTMLMQKEIDAQMLIVLFVTIFISSLMGAVMRYLYTPIGYTIRYQLMFELMKKNMYMPLHKFEDPEHLDKQELVILPLQSIEGVQGFYLQLAHISGALGVIAVSIGATFQIHPIIPIITIAWFVLYVKLKLDAGNFADHQVKTNQSIWRESFYLNDISRDASFAKELRVYRMQDYIHEKREQIIKRIQATLTPMERKESHILHLDNVYQFIRDGVMYGVLIVAYFAKTISLPLFSSYTSLVMQVNSAFEVIFEGFRTLSFRYPSIIRMFEYLHEEDDQKQAQPLPEASTWEIVFEHVDFHYPGNTHMVFKDLNFTLRQGKKLAIIGLNGVGKTTMMKLLMGLYPPTSGTIYFNGVDIQNIDKESYFTLFAPVFQELNIFPYSLKENLTFQNDCSDEELVEITKQVGIYEDIKTYGWDKQLTRFVDSEGLLLSGGQSQKLLMARALAYHRDILILDEPTSALDPIAEYEFYHKINNEYNDKTILFISHRLASTSFCDEILLVDAQNISEFGTHEELMQRKGMYYDLFQVQAKYYKEEELA
ncbi:ABC-type multidrug transport system fused ATPase/permease subunit [Breznakia blatticola]|uniref:ABC-type multidrug transport system fused ATPase/permease subunit n=1 Tax=Breznakia blatticola TaxID=1754012 RepID=A0A4R8A6V4_9FIRM|nr:ABC transporter ATP-binding protein [Breznakia blatticola]TDW26385.1 ABC-type multidrug transport system fused ATPase/permease subunit [Breznakia blatticola]